MRLPRKLKQTIKEFIVYLQWKFNYYPRRRFERARFDRYFDESNTTKSPDGRCPTCGVHYIFNIPECTDPNHPFWAVQYKCRDKKDDLWVWMFFNGIHEPEIIKYYPKRS